MVTRGCEHTCLGHLDGHDLFHFDNVVCRSDLVEPGMMSQPEFDFTQPPMVHKNAKDTERMAAEFIAPKVTGLRLKALQSLAAAPSGLTGSQVADKMNAWLYSVKPRLTELQNMGLAEDSGERQLNERNRPEVVWQITPAGAEFLRGKDD
jgi:hypothetical protein